MTSKLKIGILSLGCPRNLVDSENILGRLNLKGYPIVDMAEADIGIVNTCAFIEDAKRESTEAILDLIDLKKQGRLKKIIVYGCLSQRYKDSLQRELPEVDAFVGRVSLNHEAKRFSIIPRHFAYLKICESCLNHCSYCIIPKIKGAFSSLEEEVILKKVALFEQDKVSELNIIGQDISAYGKDLYGCFSLPDLIKKISKKAKHIHWIRLLYLYPTRISDELLRVIKDEPCVCKYIDVPIQHINERILRLMNRRTAKIEIIRLIEKIKKNIPNVALRTSLIVGFPSETDKEFKELLNFVEEIKFERLGVFMYSREEDTPAYSLRPQISRKVKVERFNIIMEKQQRISQENNQRLLGTTMEVLIDELDDEGRYVGRTQYDAPEVDGAVYVTSKRLLEPGDFAKVKITDTLEYDLVGEAF